MLAQPIATHGCMTHMAAELGLRSLRWPLPQQGRTVGGRTPCPADLTGSAPPHHSEMKMLKGQQHPWQPGKGDPGGLGRLWIFAGSAQLCFAPASALEGPLQSGCSPRLGNTNPLMKEALSSTPTTSHLVTPFPPPPV